MSDILTASQRHRCMSRIRGKNTKPEILVRKGLHARGFRFRLHNKKLPGSPDIVLPKYGVAITVNGCFWHGHKGCRYATKPKTNIEFWETKIAGNRHRDEVTIAHLEALGYNRLIDAFPAKTLMENGITVACNCDFPICNVNPMLGIYSMVVRKTEKGQSFGGRQEAIDRMLALRAYTKNAAYLLWKEDELGSLKAGKIADIVVFEDDFLEVPDEELKDVRVYMTVANGETVYQMKQK